MVEYTLPKAGCLARVSLLDGADLNQVLGLQETTRAALSPDMKMFVLPQGMIYFQNLLMRQTGVMIGIHAQGQEDSGSKGLLIAQMALMGPMVLRDAIAQNFITYNNEVPFHHAGLSDSVIIFKSMAVHPDWRGNDLAKHLVSFALELPFAKVADHLFAQISVGNKRSWDVFAQQGFGIVAAALDPKDNQPRFVFQKPAIPFDLSDAVIVDEVDPTEDFSAIVNLTQREALVGLYDENFPSKLAFLRNRDVLNIMPTRARLTATD